MDVDRIRAGGDRIGKLFRPQQFLGRSARGRRRCAASRERRPGCRRHATGLSRNPARIRRRYCAALQACRRPSISAAPSAIASVASMPRRLMLNQPSLLNGIAARMQRGARQAPFVVAAARQRGDLGLRQRVESREVDRPEAKHHRRGLQRLAFVESEEGGAGALQRIHVAGSVDQHLRTQRQPRRSWSARARRRCAGRSRPRRARWRAAAGARRPRCTISSSTSLSTSGAYSTRSILWPVDITKVACSPAPP